MDYDSNTYDCTFASGFQDVLTVMYTAVADELILPSLFTGVSNSLTCLPQENTKLSMKDLRQHAF